MSTPDRPPADRGPEYPSVTRYRAGDRVWIWVDQGWHPAVIAAPLGHVASVRYHTTSGRVGLDVFPALYLWPGRLDPDPLIDPDPLGSQPLPRRGGDLP